MAGPLLRAATCMDTNTPDRHFVVGAHPDHPRVSVACGFSGHGFKFTPVIGEILADLATDGSTAHRSPCSTRCGRSPGNPAGLGNTIWGGARSG
jgi:glycine/D-amino acid oxidase-like deaminating enzyme